MANFSFLTAMKLHFDNFRIVLDSFLPAFLVCGAAFFWKAGETFLVSFSLLSFRFVLHLNKQASVVSQACVDISLPIRSQLTFVSRF